MIGVFIFVQNFALRPKRITQDMTGFNEILPRVLDVTEDFWVNAGQKYKMEQILCPEFIVPDPKVDPRYLSCNPLFWECYWSKGVKKTPELRVEHEGQVFHIEAIQKKNGKFGKLASSPTWSYQVELRIRELPEYPIHLALFNSCQDFYLPERVYAYGVSQTSRAQDVFLWDNFGRNLYLDRFPVSNREINQWISLHPKMNHLKIDEVKKLPFPATHLNLAEQKEYCADSGARLMEPHLFDAASMIPSSDETRPEVISPSATPWERDTGRTFLGSEHNPKPEDCKKAAVRGCAMYPYSTNSSTWMGLNYTLGFFPESFRFVYDQFNTKFSSIFISPKSAWNRLGKRGIWSGEGHSPQDFGTGSLDEENPFLGLEKIPVSFRCYREVLE